MISWINFGGRLCRRLLAKNLGHVRVHFSWKILYQDIYFKSSVMDVSKTLSKRAFSFFSTCFPHNPSFPDYLVREEIKNYSSWPTIPQVYPCIVRLFDGNGREVWGSRRITENKEVHSYPGKELG